MGPFRWVAIAAARLYRTWLRNQHGGTLVHRLHRFLIAAFLGYLFGDRTGGPTRLPMAVARFSGCVRGDRGPAAVLGRVSPRERRSQLSSASFALGRTTAQNAGFGARSASNSNGRLVRDTGNFVSHVCASETPHVVTLFTLG